MAPQLNDFKTNPTYIWNQLIEKFFEKFDFSPAEKKPKF
jgi:hypothetical protein